MGRFARREERAVRRGLARGLLLGFLVRVQVAGECFCTNRLGFRSSISKAGELRAWLKKTNPAVIPAARASAR